MSAGRSIARWQETPGNRRQHRPATVVCVAGGDWRRWLGERGCAELGARRHQADRADRVRSGEADPACLRCGGVLKSAIVMFGQALDRVVLAKAVRECDLMLAVGSTLIVEPAASLCAVAVEDGACLVNRDPTPYDELATEVINEPIGAAVPRIAELLRRQ
jgi:NAD-dependent deacetylase